VATGQGSPSGPEQGLERLSHSRGTSSFRRELLGLFLVLCEFSHRLRGRAIQIRGDNMGAMRALMRGRATRYEDWRLIRAIRLLLFELRCPLINCVWIPRDRLTEVDALSRGDPGDWESAPALLELANRTNPWGRRHELDLFASPSNTKCERFFSRYYFRRAEAVDAFTQPWGRDGEVAWACPPFALIPRVLQHAVECGARVTLVYPEWPAMPWWPLLQALRVGEPVLLNPHRHFRPGLSGRCEAWGPRGDGGEGLHRAMCMAFLDPRAAALGDGSRTRCSSP
jgi:hypothetical protein